MMARSTKRMATGGVALSVLLALGACSSDGSDGDGRFVDEQGGGTGTTGATIGGTTGGTGANIGGTTSGTGGTGADIGGTTGSGGEPQFTFECGGDTIVAGPGDTVTCDGQAYTIDANGVATPVGGGTGTGTGTGGTPGGDVASQLITFLESPDAFDAWGCQAPDQSFNVGYLFPTPNVGLYLQLIENGEALEFSYSVSGTTANLSLENGLQETISGISFASARAWTGNSSLHGRLSCELIEIRQ